ncbi:Monoculm1, putative [Babesia ovata]|uniref:Monoculm1, putative n=1 Tax=Babesia ovata TaxID=189622 RepID=A0A2H6KFJ8_9APIC|nr:Monoculm1, putative [Babesia ovata]GBE61765.1 Monoculm1, putative [Babesia ovata]
MLTYRFARRGSYWCDAGGHGVFGVGRAVEIKRRLIGRWHWRPHPHLRVGAIEASVRIVHVFDGQRATLEHLRRLVALQHLIFQPVLEFFRGQLEPRFGVAGFRNQGDNIDRIVLLDVGFCVVYVAFVPGGSDVRPLVHVRQLTIVASLLQHGHQLRVKRLRFLARENAQYHAFVRPYGPEHVRMRCDEGWHEGVKILVRVVGDQR